MVPCLWTTKLYSHFLFQTNPFFFDLPVLLSFFCYIIQYDILELLDEPKKRLSSYNLHFQLAMHPKQIWDLIWNVLVGHVDRRLEYAKPRSISHFKAFNKSLTFAEKAMLLRKVISMELSTKQFHRACMHLSLKKKIRIRILADLGNLPTFEVAQKKYPLLQREDQVSKWIVAFRSLKEGTRPYGWQNFITMIKDNVITRSQEGAKKLKCGNCYYQLHNQKYQALNVEYDNKSLAIGTYFIILVYVLYLLHWYP